MSENVNIIRYYYQYTPVRRGLTGAEYLGQYIDEHYDNLCRWIEVGQKDYLHYGILEGTNADLLAKVIAAIEGKFSAQRLTEEEFIGAIYLIYNPPSFIRPEENNTINEDIFNFSNFIARYDIQVTEEEAFNYAKQYKKKLFKELLRKRFEDYNDLIADVTKLFVLLNVHYNNLTDEEKAQLNEKLNMLGEIYSKENCLQSLDKMINKLTQYGILYYNKINELENAKNKDELNEIQLIV